MSSGYSKPSVFITVKIERGKCEDIENYFRKTISLGGCRFSISKADKVSDQFGAIRRYRLTFNSMHHAIHGYGIIHSIMGEDPEIWRQSPHKIRFTWIYVSPIVKTVVLDKKTARDKKLGLYVVQLGEAKAYDSMGNFVGYLEKVSTIGE